MKTEYLSPVSATQRFPYMHEAAEFASTLRVSGLYVTIDDNAAGLSGAAYDEATREYRFTVNARPFAVGDGATICHYSDRTACTVIARTAKTLTLQEDTSTLLNGFDSNEPDKLVCTPGGFCGHVEGTQRYSYTPNPQGVTYKAHLTKRGWQVKGERVVGGRSHYYDYNF